MERTIVVYYSNNGSNRFLAHKIAEHLSCKVEELRPRVRSHLLLLFGPPLGNKPIKNDLTAFHRVVLVGPIWMGRFIPPLKDFVRKNKRMIKKLIFVTCCGSSFEVKDEKFGHDLVFQKVRELFGGPLQCEAFPIPLVLPDDQKEDPQLIMNTRLSEDNFKGEIQRRFDEFIKKISA
jgi:flavodoxin